MAYLASRFIRKTLLPGESVVRDAQFPVYYTFMCFAFFAGCFFTGIMAHRGLLHGGIYTLIPVHIGFFGGLLMFFYMMLKKWTTEIILTDKRLIYKWGIISIIAREVDIEQLASHDVQQTLFGRMMDYGVVHIRCIEASDIFLPPVDKPFEFRNALEKQKQQYREKYMKVERLRRHGPEDGQQQAAEERVEAMSPA